MEHIPLLEQNGSIPPGESRRVEIPKEFAPIIEAYERMGAFGKWWRRVWCTHTATMNIAYCMQHDRSCAEDNLTLDHVIPKSRGGQDTWTNLVACCRKCNNTKNDQTPEEAGMMLLRKPHRPHHIAFLKAVSREVLQGWEPYLFN